MTEAQMRKLIAEEFPGSIIDFFDRGEDRCVRVEFEEKAAVTEICKIDGVIPTNLVLDDVYQGYRVELIKLKEKK